MKQSKFLTRGDVGPGILVTIKEVKEFNVAAEGAPEEWKWCLVLEDQEKPMVLNSTNLQLVAQITQAEETEQWAGKKIVLYDDPTVNFRGKVTGGIRVRAQRVKQSAVPARPAPKASVPPPGPPPDDSPDLTDDDIPF